MTIDWGVVLGLGVIAYIIYALTVPTKGHIKRLQEERDQQQQRDARKVQRNVSRAIAIASVAYDRGPIHGFVTSVKPASVIFEGIAKGDYSETRFLHVSADGIITHYLTEDEAQAKYTVGDFGLSAVTMTEGLIQFRNIVPKAIDPKNAYNLKFTFSLIS